MKELFLMLLPFLVDTVFDGTGVDLCTVPDDFDPRGNSIGVSAVDTSAFLEKIQFAQFMSVDNAEISEVRFWDFIYGKIDLLIEPYDAMNTDDRR